MFNVVTFTVFAIISLIVLILSVHFHLMQNRQTNNLICAQKIKATIVRREVVDDIYNHPNNEYSYTYRYRWNNADKECEPIYPLYQELEIGSQIDLNITPKGTIVFQSDINSAAELKKLSFYLGIFIMALGMFMAIAA